MKILNFLKLLDNEDGISWTTIAFITILVKIIISPSVEWGPLLAFAASNANYMHRRIINNQAGVNDAK
ncbi:MAG: hypothetical protein NVS1B10_06450 [Candidatus Saccharimonadales bacterium]